MAHQHNHMSQQEQMQKQDERINAALGKVKHKLLVMSGKGGVGKSSVAVNLAVALANAGHKVGLMDVDLHGPTVPLLLGLVGRLPESDGEMMIPIPYDERLTVVSMGNLLDDNDRAIIWRGPLKIGAIRQFISDVNWGELDFLVIDSPPGTGDEPLTVAQTIPGAQAIIVTTPQEVSLADVRKSINFCKQVGMPILGLIENMAGYICPHCGHAEALFGAGNLDRTTLKTGVQALGSVPFDPKIVLTGDKGEPFLAENADTPAGQSFAKIVKAIVGLLPEKPAAAPKKEEPAAAAPQAAIGGDHLVAVPTAEGKLCMHFGHCQIMTLVQVKDGKIVDKQELTPPEHEPGVLPAWLAEKGATLILAGGMGSRAQGLFADNGIQVVVGSPAIAPEEAVQLWLSGKLVTGANVCDH